MSVTITAAQLKLRLKLPDPTPEELTAGVDVVGDLLATATELVDSYARDCPDSISNSAVVRLGGWLKRGSGAPDSISAGGVRMSWRQARGRSALQSSGAQTLLAPWHKPRSLVLEND